ncbi:MAG: C39 family peptidase [Planctomycetes bacterium]|nr:C39 family peptidase [Planctomycetota bacterium]
MTNDALVVEIVGLLGQTNIVLRQLDSLITEMLDLVTHDTLSPTVIPYSQNDPRWAKQRYAADLTFARAGCYVTCVAMLNTLTGSKLTPPQVAVKMREVGCFNGEMLSNPHLIPLALPDLKWPAGAYWNRSGSTLTDLEWDMVKSSVLADRALILKVDYKPDNDLFNMHFILAIGLHGDDDLIILDPIDGQRSTLLERYGDAQGWTARQAIFGYRGLRVNETTV